MGRFHRARWGSRIEQWLDDELDSSRSELALMHVTGCPGCLHEVEMLARLKRSLASLGNQ